MDAAVLVVGGDKEFIQNVFRTKLAGHGIRVGWVWDRHENPDYVLPADCGAVLIIHTAIGHGMDRQAAVMARDAGVPVIRVSHKFSQALPVLRAMGLAEAESNGVDKPAPSTEDKYDLVLSYLMEELPKGRHPSRGEVRGIVKRAFGPHVSITDSILRRARSVAAVETATHGEPMPAAVPTQDLNQLAEWVILLIEERPEAPIDQMITRLRELTVGKLPSDNELHAFISEVFAEQKVLWQQHHSTWDDDKRQSIKDMRWAWAKRFMQAAQEQDGVFPPYIAVIEASEALFGKPVHSVSIKKIRDEIQAEQGRAPEPISIPEPEAEEPVTQNKPKFNPARLDEAAKFAKAWHKDLTPPQAAMLHDWANRILRNPSKARTSTEVKDLFVTFRRKPLEFAGAFLLVVPKGKQVTRGMVRGAYKKVMKVGMDTYAVDPIAEVMRLTNRLTDKSPKVDDTEPVEGFFASLNDAYNYYLKHAVEHISRGKFRALLAEGKIESQREGDGVYAPWLVSHAALDEYLREHALGETTGTPAPPDEPEAESDDVAALKAHIAALERSVHDSDKLAETYMQDSEEWQRKAAAWEAKAKDAEGKADSAIQEARDWKAKAATASTRYNTEKQRADKQQGRADNLQMVLTGHRGREHNLITEIERLKGKIEALSDSEAAKRIEMLTQNLEASQRLLGEWEAEGRRLEGEKVDLQGRLDDTLGKLRIATGDLGIAQEQIALEAAASVAPASSSMTVDELIREAMKNGYSFVLRPEAGE